MLSGGLLSAAALAYTCDQLLLDIVSRYYSGFSLEPAPDKYVLLFGGVTALLALLLFGVLPAWQISDIDSATALKAASRSLSGGRATNRRILICAQVTLTLVLVTGAAVFIETLRHLQTERLGFQSEAVVDAQLIPLPRAFPDKFDVGNYCRDLVDRMKSLPGVEAVSMSSFSPLFTMPYKEDIRRTDSPERAILQAPGEFVTDGFLSTMRIPLLQGHDFSRRDNSQSRKTAIVSRSLSAPVQSIPWSPYAMNSLYAASLPEGLTSSMPNNSESPQKCVTLHGIWRKSLQAIWRKIDPRDGRGVILIGVAGID